MKMTKKIVFLLILALVSLIIWIYRSSSLEYSDSLIIIKENYYIKNVQIQPSEVCNGSPFIIILVTSYVGHIELRSAHRRAMPAEYLSPLKVFRVFLLAKIPANERYITQEAIIDESKTFNDIVQGSFYENYRNLTYKHLMGLEWASRICNKASFILKVDDDTVFNFNRTYEFLTKVPRMQQKSLIMGYILNNTLPRRNKQNKWFVTQDEYPRNIYPPYLSGWYYIITPEIASLLSDEAKFHPLFWIDDIFVTGILTESLGLKLKQLPEKYWLEYYELIECCLRDMTSKSIECDYVVGPNGGRNNLLVEFNESYSDCQKRGNCTKRLPNQNLKTNCVMYRERTIFSNGVAQVQHIKL